MNLKIIILSKSDKERQILHDVIYMWDLKFDTNELTYTIEINSRTQKTNLSLQKRKEEG